MTLTRVAAMALLGVASMTTIGRVARASEQGQPLDDSSSEVTDADAASDPPAVAVPTTWPAHIPSPDDPVIEVVLLTQTHPRPAAHHGLSPATYGLLIGALGGAVLGSRSDHDARTLMDPDSCRCAVLPGFVLGGLIGLGVGALVGALSEPGDAP